MSKDFLWHKLALTRNIGPKKFHQLVSHYPLDEIFRRISTWENIAIPSDDQVNAHFARLDRCSIIALRSDEALYPKRLFHLSDPPPILYLHGNAELLQKPIVAIVGARHASLAGRKFTHKISKSLTAHQQLIISGLARGIDTAAHQGALPGANLAVVACGLDCYYPPENQALQQEIIQKGAVISEMPPGVKPQANLFPRRNRIIAALAQVIIIIEAGLKSGSLITAKMAADLGREVGAVPGFPTDKNAEGSNYLIKNGAAVIEDIDDIFALLEQPIEQTPITRKAPQKPAKASHKNILDLLSKTPVSLEHLAAHLQLSTQDILPTILELEMEGELERISGDEIVKN